MKKPDSFGIWEELNLRRRFFTPFSFTTLPPPRPPLLSVCLSVCLTSPFSTTIRHRDELYQKLNIVPSKKWRDRKPETDTGCLPKAVTPEIHVCKCRNFNIDILDAFFSHDFNFKKQIYCFVFFFENVEIVVPNFWKLWFESNLAKICLIWFVSRFCRSLARDFHSKSCLKLHLIDLIESTFHATRSLQCRRFRAFENCRPPLWGFFYTWNFTSSTLLNEPLIHYCHHLVC